MKTRVTVMAGLALLGAGVFLGTLVPASRAGDGMMDEQAMQEAMRKYEAYATPGEQHQKLLDTVGTWNVTTKMWMSPGDEPVTSTGKAVVEAILDGRYVTETYKAMMDMGNGPQPFEGHNVIGYDNLQKAYVYAWVDNFGTGIMTGKGNYDASGKTLTMISENCPEPVSGTFIPAKSVTREVGPDERVFEMYSGSPDGTWTKMMEMTYKRAH